MLKREPRSAGILPRRALPEHSKRPKKHPDLSPVSAWKGGRERIRKDRFKSEPHPRDHSEALELEVPESDFMAVILQPDMAGPGGSVIGIILPFSGLPFSVPFFRPSFERDDLDAVQPMLDMPVVEDDFR